MDQDAYDRLPYPGHPYPDTHIEHLHSLGCWFGLRPAPPEQCRVLELGCGDGANLAPMAAQYPGSQFTGLDLARQPIARAEALSREIGLRNTQWLAADLCDWQHQGPYDYIIVHGLYSWVPEAVRQALLQLLARALAPQGIAFVSYNCYPGCHRRAQVREMLRYHVEALDSEHARLSEARALLQMLAGARVETDVAAQAWRRELERAARSADGALFHDDLAEVNQPFYFHEFLAQAEGAGLQFLAEAELSAMGMHGLSVEARAALGQLDPLAREQYLDFVRERRFRQSLLCRQDLSPNRQPAAGQLAAYHLSADLKLQGELSATAPHSQQTVMRDALLALQATAPRSLPVPTLLTSLLSLHAPAHAEAGLLAILHAGLMSGLVRLHAQALPLPEQVSARPVASAVARAELRLDPARAAVTTLRHDLTMLDEPGVRDLLPLLDGSRDHAALAAESGLDAATLDTHLRRLYELALLSA
jgi:SAM-dependent methyltransferase